MPSTRDNFFAMLAKGGQMGADGYQQSQDHKLRELLQVKQQEHDLAKQAAGHLHEDEVFSRGQSMLKNMQGSNPDRSVSVHGVGSIGAPMSPSQLMPKLTPAQEAAEGLAGKEITNYAVTGGKGALEKDLAALREAATELEDGGRDSYDQYVGGLLSTHPTLMGLLAPKEKARRDKVRNTVLDSIRKTDANPTEKQIENVMGQTYDPSSNNENNASRVRRFLTQQEKKAQQLEEAYQKYQDTGYATLGGPSLGENYQEEDETVGDVVDAANAPSAGGSLSKSQKIRLQQLRAKHRGK